MLSLHRDRNHDVANNFGHADAHRSGQHYFRVAVETTESALGEDGTLATIPGTQTTIDIHTGEKRVLDYLIQPVLKIRSEAFRER